MLCKRLFQVLVMVTVETYVDSNDEIEQSRVELLLKSPNLPKYIDLHSSVGAKVISVSPGRIWKVG